MKKINTKWGYFPDTPAGLCEMAQAILSDVSSKIPEDEISSLHTVQKSLKILSGDILHIQRQVDIRLTGVGDGEAGA